jgi:hypothetical protein
MPPDHETRKQAVPAARWSPALRRLGAALTAAATLLALGLRPAEAAVMLAPGTILPGQGYIDLGAPYADFVVAIRRVSPSTGAVSYATGIKISPYHVVTAAHVIDHSSGFRPVENLTILGGTNYLSPSFTSAVSSYTIHPSYVQGSLLGTGSQLDLAIITSSTKLSGGFATLSSNPILNGDIITFAGYGQPALDPSAPQLASDRDGYLRAFQGIAGNPASIYDNVLYGGANGTVSSLMPWEGLASQGDSGAGAFKGMELGGMAFAIVGTTSTQWADFNSQSARDFLMSVTRGLGFRLADLNIAPASGGQGPRLSGKVHGGPGLASIRIEASSALGAGAVWQTIGTVTLDQSGSATFADLLDNRPEAATATKSFYRAATVP